LITLPDDRLNRTHTKLAAAALLTAIAAAGAFLLLGQPGAPLRERVARLAVKDKPTVMGWPVAIGEVAGGFADPFGVVLDRAGNAYIADAGDHNQIRKIAPDGTVSVLAGGAEGFADGSGAQAAFNTPSGMAIDGQGNLLVADTANNAIRKVTPQGVVSTVAGDGSAGFADGPAAQARFNGPLGVALDKAGNVYVADTYNDRIRKIGIDGMVTTVAGSVPGAQDGAAALATFDTPVALVLDPRGGMYVADARLGAIRRIGADGQVSTLALSDPEADDPLLRRPLSLALTHDGFLYVGDMARGRILQLSPTGQLGGLTGIGIDIQIGDAQATRFARPAGIALAADGSLLVTDAVQRVLRKIAPRTAAAPVTRPVAEAAPASAAPPVSAPAAVVLPAPGSFPWPRAPQFGKHEVVGIIGEARGSYDGESRHHFHNGLDVQGNMGVPVLAVASEKVSSPLPNWGYGELGEGIGIDSFAYYHLRVGRDVKNAPLDPARFALLAGADGKTERVRIKRGTRFKVGEALGTVNRMFHVHLVHRTPKGEANPLALPFPGVEDSVIPRIDGIALHDAADTRLTAKEGKRLLVPRGAGPLSIVVDAYDPTDGKAAPPKLGLYKAGYQVLAADGTPLPGFETPRMNIEFNQLPPDRESVQVAYANGSGITVYGNKTTRFLYVVTNRVRDGAAAQGSWDPATLAPGDYIIRISASDYAGNEAVAGRDLAIAVR
jgi:streptogramin lyase